MAEKEYEYDIFISYASEEREWVRLHLYEPLQRCLRRSDRGHPRVFYDVDSMKIGGDFMDKLGAALQKSRKIVTVYSRLYFSKRMCRWELSTAASFDPDGAAGVLQPILREPQAMTEIPPSVRIRHYLDVHAFTDWFTRLCATLDLLPPSEQLHLSFLDQPPAEIIKDSLLPPLRVTLKAADGSRLNRDETVTLQIDKGSLSGHCTAQVVDGVATFQGAVVHGAGTGVLLKAVINGYEPAISQPFAIVPPVVIPAVPMPRDVVFHAIPGEAIFFDDGKAMAIVGESSALVFDLQNPSEPIATVELKSQIRFWRRKDSLLVIGDWDGSIYIVCSDGRAGAHHLGATERFSVPGDVAIDGDHVYAGFWRGDVYCLGLSDSRELLFTHAPGVHRIGFARDVIIVAGHDGATAIYQGNTVSKSLELAAPVHLIKQYPECVVVVSERHAYQLTWPQLSVFTDSVPIAGVAAVFGECNCPVVIDAEGQGCRYDADLLAAPLRARAGAVPVSADNAGKYCIFRNPDGSHTLMVNEQLAMNLVGGAFAVAPNGKLFAVGEGFDIRLFTDDVLESRFDHAGAEDG